MSYEDVSILVVEDEPQIRQMVRGLLKGLGIHNVLEAGDGGTALSLLDSGDRHVDVIVCDWNMPALSGIELLRQIRMAHPAMPFLMLTGRADVNSVTSARDSGVDAYLAKPFSRDQFVAKMHILLNRQRRRLA